MDGGMNELIVGVMDLTEAGPNQPVGKQRSFDKGSDRIVYTSVSGLPSACPFCITPSLSILNSDATADAEDAC